MEDLNEMDRFPSRLKKIQFHGSACNFFFPLCFKLCCESISPCLFNTKLTAVDGKEKHAIH